MNASFGSSVPVDNTLPAYEIHAIEKLYALSPNYITGEEEKERQQCEGRQVE